MMVLVLAGMVHNSGDYLHTLIEALSLSFADTLWYNADPSKVKVPINGLLSKEYADQRRLLIKPHRFVYISVAALNLEHQPNVKYQLTRLAGFSLWMLSFFQCLHAA